MQQVLAASQGEAVKVTDSSAQTGGPKNAGRLVRDPEGVKLVEGEKPPPDMGTIIKRLKISVPILRQA